ncbi:MAG: aminotransferase class I/II-fold pyridoxal phosphate-dependent enzyme [Bacteroidota bacterium]
MTKFTKLVESLPPTVPFVAPEETERQRGRPFAARIGANESVFGPSPRALEAMAKAAADSWMYGDPSNHDLRQALAAYHAIPAEAIRIGEGIDGLFGLVVRLLIEPGDAVVTSAGAYPTFNYHVAGFGGELHTKTLLNINNIDVQTKSIASGGANFGVTTTLGLQYVLTAHLHLSIGMSGVFQNYTPAMSELITLKLNGKDELVNMDANDRTITYVEEVVVQEEDFNMTGEIQGEALQQHYSLSSIGVALKLSYVFGQ